MLIRPASDIKSSEITPQSVYLTRRQFMTGIGTMTAACLGHASPRWQGVKSYPSPQWLRDKVRLAEILPNTIGEQPTPYKYASEYNNFYEFGSSKQDPHKNAQQFVTDPWSVVVSGEIDKPTTYALEDLLKPHMLEERIYRFRCVEAWSMVVPWIGFSLGSLLKRVNMTANAKFVAFTTLYDPEQMPGQRSFLSTIDYPYREGLRIDEAMHPLTLMAIGMYGDTLPPQNGAPLRLVVPWKYGFKSIKSIVRIHLTKSRPETTWEKTAPDEYGFYANVNPEVNHPRWSQATERRLPSSLFSSNRIRTKLFNGYAQDVGHLYKGMDLKKYF